MDQQATVSSGVMQAMVLRAQGQPLEAAELPIPEPGPGEVLVQLLACGVCHTDVHIRAGHVASSGMPAGLILGHEGVGRVVACGTGADPALLGRMVGMPWIHDTCRSCPECLSGHESFCQFQRANGFSVHGAYAEYMVADAAFVARIPDGLDPLAVAPLMCAGLTAYGGVKRARITPGSRVAIFGCGGLGLYAVQIARRAGAEVFAVDVSEAKLEQARRCGADHVLIAGPGTGDEILAAGGADAVINFAPTPATWPSMLKAVRRLGRVVAAALVSEPVPVSQDWLTMTGVEITGTSVGTRLELQELLRMHVREPFVSDLTPVRLEAVNAALDALEAGKVNGRQVIDFGLT